MFKRLLVLCVCLLVCRVALASPDANTLTLLHFEGNHGDTTTQDIVTGATFARMSPSEFKNSDRFTRPLDTMISTVNFKYGTGSAHIGTPAGWGAFRTSNSFNFGGDGGSGTLECWVYLTDISRKQYVACSYFNCNFYWYIGFTSDNRIVMSALQSAPGVVTDGEWFHLAVVKNGSTTSIYKDGTLVAGTNTLSYGSSQPPDRVLYVGIGGDNNPYCNGYSIAGYIDEFRLSSIARYTSDFTPPSNGYVNPLDIRFYYTGTGTAVWPNSSLGGSQTANEIPDMTHNVFDWVSASEAATGDTEYRAIDVKNDSITDNLQNVVVWLADQGTYSTVSYGYDAGGTQTVANESTAPVGITFGTGTTKATGVNIGNLATGEKKRLWLKRVIPVGATQATDNITLRVEGMAP